MPFRLIITVDWNRNKQRAAAGVAPALTRRGLILSADETPVANKQAVSQVWKLTFVGGCLLQRAIDPL